MSIATPFQGSLFANDFFRDSIARLDDWSELDAAALDAFEVSVRDVFDGFPIAGSPNESQTEDDLIWPVLEQLGWTASLRQQNLSAHGREDVPDGLLFRDAAAKGRANGFTEEWKRYEFGLAVVESKRWGRPLDRRSGRRGEETAPSTQMLRYLRRVDDLTTGKLRWGILTNGARWRLYYQGARSVSEQFFEIDLVALLDLPGYDDGLLALTEADRRRWLKVFVLVFRREAFLAGTADPRTFHQRAIKEGRYYEKRVAANLAALFEQTPVGRRYINYRDLGVQQLGSIYERLLEHEIVRHDGEIAIRPNVFARKGSGSYYTPDDLVGLIIKETIEPLVRSRMDDFIAKNSELPASHLPEDRRIGQLKQVDPAEKLLELKVCDPAMGSGHFLVNLVDHLADRVITAMAEAEALVDDYISPLTERIDVIRNTIIDNAEKRGWAVDAEQLDDRHIVRRMVLKRCVYGVDKNPMAVELAKVALWLHTFTVGAPLSFLDHHLRCGDSLFGSWVRTGIDKATEQGGSLFLEGPVKRATRAAAPMQIIEGLTDAEIAEAHRSAEVFAEIEEMTTPLNAFLSLAHAFDWLSIRDRDDQASLYTPYFAGIFGDPIDIASGKSEVLAKVQDGERFADLLDEARQLLDDERFFNWQVAFPGVWSEWESTGLNGGFDAVIGNPPWDRMKLQQVEWFAARRAEIAHAQRAADRKRMIVDLEKAGDPLVRDFAEANESATAAVRMARGGGDYPLLSGGDVNLYSLFVERAMTLVKPDGMVGLLTPSGIASDKTAARFFKGVATEGRLRALYDFENRRTRYDAQPFFPDVDSRFKFCAFVASPTLTEDMAKCAFFLQDVSELEDPERCFPLTAAGFARVNPNTGTAPIFRTRRDAELTTAIYGRLPVLVDRSSGEEVKAWPVKYTRMFDMTNDSGLFRTRAELEEQEGAYPVGGNRFSSPSGDWVPLYEGKMVQAFDHRAASVVVNPENQHRPAQPVPATPEQHRNPDWLPDAQFWVPASECGWTAGSDWVLGFKEITAPTNVRTFIAALLPTVGFGNKVPILKPEATNRAEWLLAANLNATILDFVARQKIQGQTLNLFIVEQLPVVPPERYEAVRFGPKTASKIVREAVLELTYTAHDMAPFARDMGYADEAGKVKPPFPWNEDRRLLLRSRLDAVFFHLYGVTDRDDIRYIYSTFPIIERGEKAAHGGVYRSCELCLAWMNALAAGDPDAEIYL